MSEKTELLKRAIDLIEINRLNDASFVEHDDAAAANQLIADIKSCITEDPEQKRWPCRTVQADRRNRTATLEFDGHFEAFAGRYELVMVK